MKNTHSPEVPRILQRKLEGKIFALRINKRKNKEPLWMCEYCRSRSTGAARRKQKLPAQLFFQNKIALHSTVLIPKGT
ncbi:ECU06_1405 [Encephalitozoon cuniculi GB-M1]|uniref:ECU06_1405 protein n=1 Tax=Encephalitozoon cuniculi (strain GB-M1) TaxID=284813 RepID=I7JU00_ENCCU|nr:uncharacterized protein ECU06_1405 [Encephalitozoon cuniculi GB-M1]UYI27735.1 hypothetical protein J0A71_07g16170 [Encephalitozoon cuniculi]CCI73949.1 ECU06_1405 [Encephalitozoon cuniculi GB-M1]